MSPRFSCAPWLAAALCIPGSTSAGATNQARGASTAQQPLAATDTELTARLRELRSGR